MSGHDEFCPCSDRSWSRREFCECDLITRVRADEREKIAQSIEADEWIIGRNIAARVARNGGRDD